ncbi:G protein-coupled receptor [Caenorhabditis elegans]|uniref:G protein-coupled receptor n=1 Tax=Caenorhabditis elegans TaxID=6239 RepID=O45314_CAEEL|nr:G protein-coupled receptor [Caenorhabditis elegans]CAB03997.2 G protein-coupled receptor [Caenorhabditis elegans]|eukprot:NP_507674.2 Serpentine Receptor, class I [Caenorhabditis elegans]
MPAPCPETLPAYYMPTLHVIGAISIPMNVLGFYMVWFQSPGMQGYKYCLCYMQSVSMLTELYMSWICPSYFFFPLAGGYILEENFRRFVSTHASLTIWVFIFCFVLSAALTCFVYRHNAAAQINQDYSGKMYFEKLLLVLTHIFPFFTGFGTWMSQLTYEQKYDYVRQNYPQCLSWMAYDGFEAYNWQVNTWIPVAGLGGIGWVFVVASYCLYLGVHTMMILQRLRAHMSPQTYQMHRTALISLTMQMVIPGMLLTTPLYMILVVIMTNSLAFEELASTFSFLMSSHSMCQCFVMVMSNGVYRRVLKEKVFRLLRLPVPNESQVGSLVEPSMRISNNFVGTVLNA